MARKPILYEKPEGVRDYLPHRAGLRRQLERRLAETYRLWGYEEIITPSFEYLETFLNGLRGQEDRLFKFIERSGKTVVLRPEMTTPIARVVSSLLKERALPLRLFYIASIFRRQEVVTGRDTEFTQAGIEYFGDASPNADAEIIALAVTALQNLGLQGFRIAIGQVTFLHGFLEEHVPDSADRQELMQALLSKDFVQYEECVSTYLEERRITEDNQAALLWLQRARGGREVLSSAREYANSAPALAGLTNLDAIWEVLVLHGATDFVQVDLGLLPDLDYYTGCVLEGYAPGIGFPVVSGGRYDEMTGKFGRSTPATGFMIGIERVMEALERTRPLRAQLPNLLLFDEHSKKAAISFGNFVRGEGLELACSLASVYQNDAAIPAAKVVGRLEYSRLLTQDLTLLGLWQEWQLQRGEQQ